MKFYGQEDLVTEILQLVKSCHQGKNYNILIKGKSGTGKTTIAKLFLSYLNKPSESTIIVADDLNFSSMFEGKRFIVIDEAHQITKPEWLYSHLDKHDKTFIIVTNETGKLKEPLANRCVQLTIKDYSIGELYAITEEALELKLPREFLLRIIEVGKNNPRIIVDNICKRLNYLLEKIPESLSEFEKYLNQLGFVNGLDVQERQYLSTIRQLGGVASLALISSALHLTKETIQRDIEPYLVGKFVVITTKGRMLT